MRTRKRWVAETVMLHLGAFLVLLFSIIAVFINWWLS